jgi:uncharacterized protein (DUF885 family)
MLKRYLIPLCFVFGLVSCNNENKSRGEAEEREQASARFDSLLDSYYEDGLKLNPVMATTAGDMRYNDQFPNFLSQEYEDSLRAYYVNYRLQAHEIDDMGLSESEQMSKAILLWECNINLESMNFDKDRYMPIDQMWSVNLFMGQLASGASSQPFETVEDYENWQKRVDGFLEWMESAEENMREGLEHGYVLPRALIVKVVPQLAAMTGNVEDHLFFGPVRNFPQDFSEEDKKRITAEYRAMVKKK